MPRTRRHCLEALAVGLLASVPVTSTQASAPELQCAWSVPPVGRAGGPVPLRFALANRGRQTLQLLEWGTPFEGWLAPFVELLHDGVALAYAGASVKRGDPDAQEYLTLAPGAWRRVSIDLAEAFDLRAPGSYVLRSRITLHDVHAAATPVARPRSVHRPVPLSCPDLRLRLTA